MAWDLSSKPVAQVTGKRVWLALLGLVVGPVVVFVLMFLMASISSSGLLSHYVPLLLGGVVLGWKWPLFAVSTAIGGFAGWTLIHHFGGVQDGTIGDAVESSLYLVVPYVVGGATGILLGGSNGWRNRAAT